MKIKLTAVISITILSLVYGGFFLYAEDDGQTSASDTVNTVYVGTSRDQLLKIGGMEHIKKYERKGNEEVIVFDDVATATPGDTITFYLVDGKVRSWDKNIVIFPDDMETKSLLRTGMSKAELYEIYKPGNIQRYDRSGAKETIVFDDIYSSHPDDTIVFYLDDGLVSSWESGKDAVTPEERLRVIEERNKYASRSQGGATYEDSMMKAKESARASRIRSGCWYYRGGLYYR